MPQNKQKPLLSICIPTWNRGDRLKHLFENIKQELSKIQYPMEVEVVIADNASTDHTEDILKKSKIPIVYSRQNKTKGITNNIFFATCNLASGDFVWLIGDDDYILPGGINRVLKSIKNFSEVDYHYINFGSIPTDYRDKLIQLKGKIPIPKVHPQCYTKGNLLLEKAELLAFLPGSNPSHLFTSIFCYAAKRDFYLNARKNLSPSDSLDGSSLLLEDMFPQAIITLPNIIGKKIAYIGEPCLLQGAGTWEWSNNLSRISIFGIEKLFDWMDKIGFEKNALEKIRQSQSSTIASKLPPMLLSPEENIGLNHELLDILSRYTRSIDFWEKFTAKISSRIKTEFIVDTLIKKYKEIKHKKPMIGYIGDQKLQSIITNKSKSISRNIVWSAFNDNSLIGQIHKNGTPQNNHTFHLKNQKINILILGLTTPPPKKILIKIKNNLHPETIIITP